MRFLNRSQFFAWDRCLQLLNYYSWGLIAPFVACYRQVTRSRQRLVLITGSVGKTTTTRATSALLLGHTPAWIHEGDNCFGAAGWNLIRQGARTPCVPLEIGIGTPGQMDRYAWVFRPDMVIMTAIASDHVRRFHRGGKELWQEKAVIVRALRRDGLAILNGDDPVVMRMATLTKARVVTFGLSPDCDFRAEQLEIRPTGTRFLLCAQGMSVEVHSQLVGRDAVRSLVAAVAAGRALGTSLELLRTKLESLSPTPGRMQPIRLSSGATAICDDFKAGFETVQSALRTLAEMKAPRKIVVLGSLYRPQWPRGDKYTQLGMQVAAFADRIVLVGKRARLYRRGFTNLPPGVQVDEVQTIDEAVTLLRSELQAQDVVLIKGRGEEKLARIALELSGAQVHCKIAFCKLENILCQVCPYLSQSYVSARGKGASHEPGFVATSSGS